MEASLCLLVVFPSGLWAQFVEIEDDVVVKEASDVYLPQDPTYVKTEAEPQIGIPAWLLIVIIVSGTVALIICGCCCYFRHQKPVRRPNRRGVYEDEEPVDPSMIQLQERIKQGTLSGQDIEVI